MKNVFTNKRGVALMLVLSAIVVLTTMVVEFAYNTNVDYHLAQNERDRLKAYYLAKSGYNFMILELKFDKQFKSMIQSQNLAQYLGGAMQMPLCQQFPLSTALIRSVFTGGMAGLFPQGEVQNPKEEGGDEAAAEEAAAAGGEELKDKIEDLKKDVSVSQEKNAEEFLKFDGDFDGECEDESTKIDLNSFADLSKTQASTDQLSPFDQYKQFLLNLLAKSQYELLFEASDVKPSDVVDNIADWEDPDVEANRLKGGTVGAERTQYDRMHVPYAVRNRKLLTLLEAYLIDGVVDTWFSELEHLFTVYGDGKINVCTASPDVVESLITRYVTSTPNLPPVRLNDREEMDKLVKSVADGCAMGGEGDELNQNIQKSLNQALGVEEEGQGEGAEGGEQPGRGRRGERQGQERRGAAPTGFAAYIGQGGTFYTLKLTGQYMDSMVRIRTVVDVRNNDPKKWRLLYWRVY
jgi:general secretion pathway protein K